MFCQTCTKCTKCCTKFSCRGSTESVLGNLGLPWGKSKCSSNVEGGLHTTFSDQTKFDQVSKGCQLLCTSSQEPRPGRSIASADKQKCSRVGPQSIITGVLQSTLFSPKTQQQVATYPGSEQSQHFPQGGKIQNGDSRNYPNLPANRGVGNVHRLQGRLLPHTHSTYVKKISQIPCSRPNISVQGPTIWSVDSSSGVHCGDQRGQTHGITEGYKDPPVPRRLVGPGEVPPHLSSTYSNTSSSLSGFRLVSQHRKIRTDSQASFRLRRLPIQPQTRQGQAYLGMVAEPDFKNQKPVNRTYLPGPSVDVPHRAADSHRKTGSLGTTPHEAHSVAPQKQLEDP